MFNAPSQNPSTQTTAGNPATMAPPLSWSFTPAPALADAATSRIAAPHWLTAAFESISLKQLNAKADMLQRRDNKYVVPGSVLKQALSELTQHFDVLEIDARRSFTYDTCYFDDADSTSFFDHQRGRRIRCKVRMRKYVEAGLCFVEVKLKSTRGMTIKKRLKRPLETHGTLDDEAMRFIKAAYRNLYDREFEQVLKPAIEMSYQRVTLVAKQGGERMTIDFGLTFNGQQASRTVEDNLFLVETKSTNANGIADKILRALHQHPTKRCSKYCVGMATLDKVPRYNRFLVALRKLKVMPASHGTSHAPSWTRKIAVTAEAFGSKAGWGMRATTAGVN